MSEEQAQQGSEVAIAGVPPATDEHRWGVLITPERQQELAAMLRAWEALSAEEQTKRKGPFASVRQFLGEPIGVRLTGADVFYLAARALAGQAGQAGIGSDGAAGDPVA